MPEPGPIQNFCFAVDGPPEINRRAAVPSEAMIPDRPANLRPVGS